MRNLIFIICALMVTAASPVLALVSQGPPKPGEIALVLALPWGPPIADVLTSTSLQEIFPDRAPFGAFAVIPDTPSNTYQFQSGPWLILKGAAILELC